MNVDGPVGDPVFAVPNGSLPKGPPPEIGEAGLLGKLLSGDDVIGGWNGSFDAVPTGCEVSGKRFAGSLELLPKLFPVSNSPDGSLVDPGNGSLDAVPVVPNGSLVVEADSGFPKDVSVELVSEVPKGSSLPNGVDEFAEGVLSKVLLESGRLLSTEPNSLPDVEG